MSKTVNFTQMKDGTAEEYAFLTKHETEHAKGTADKLLQALVAKRLNHPPIIARCMPSSPCA